jgi:hypothetical protein
LVRSATATVVARTKKRLSPHRSGGRLLRLGRRVQTVGPHDE